MKKKPIKLDNPLVYFTYHMYSPKGYHTHFDFKEGGLSITFSERNLSYKTILKKKKHFKRWR